MITPSMIETFDAKGFLVVPDVLNSDEIEYYRNIYEQFLNNKIDASRYRSDLGGFAKTDEDVKQEKITQIMLPGRVFPELLTKKMHTLSLQMAKELLGEDMELDFDMLIDKAPFSATATPWHQDCAYWITMPDKRAASCWMALDDAIVDNGCMWYVEGSHLGPIRPHRPAGKGGGALQCDAEESEGTAVEIPAGSCVWHHGATLHYSRGNTTALRRRAYISNFRPAEMIRFERERGFDHTGEREVKDERAQDQLS
ncbi:phytanoyl-CoA dioxygenase family protein [Sediminibacterium roseum]|nr:phytanoyl-CoA dioxygenase family protein [Sediminibacterium roseum]